MNKWTIITIILLLIIFGLLLYNIYLFSKDSGRCILNPIGYYNSLGEDKCNVFCTSDEKIVS